MTRMASIEIAIAGTSILPRRVFRRANIEARDAVYRGAGNKFDVRSAMQKSWTNGADPAGVAAFRMRGRKCRGELISRVLREQRDRSTECPIKYHTQSSTLKNIRKYISRKSWDFSDGFFLSFSLIVIFSKNAKANEIKINSLMKSVVSRSGQTRWYHGPFDVRVSFAGV